MLALMSVYNYHKSGVDIDIFRLGPLGTNVGIVTANGVGIVVDAPQGAMEEIVSIAKEKHATLDALLLTHWHWDHVSDAAKFRQRGLEIYAHELDTPFIEHSEQIAALLPEFSVDACKVDHPLRDGNDLTVMGLNIRVLWIPGHVTGGVAYYFSDFGICFVGDTLFSMTVGRTDLPGGDKHALFRSIREKLYTLPDETVIIPGHGRHTTIHFEKNNNPYVRPLR